jgi:tRNA nucleotidyltransferase (CCA-adding enzyme)
VRVLHSLSFVDDPTRILRAVRYEQRFDFTIEPRTRELLVDALPLIERVSPARIRHELERILEEGEPEKVLARLDELGALEAIYPGLRFDAERAGCFQELRDRLAGRDPLAQASQEGEPLTRLYWGLWVYPLLPAQAPPTVKDSFLSEEDRRSPDWELIERLQLRGETKRLMMRLRTLKADRDALCQPQQPVSATVRLLDRVSPSILFLFSIVEKDPQVQERLIRYINEWRHVQPQVDGDYLRSLGLTPGPIYGEILGRLRDGLLDGEIQTGTAEFEWVRANYPTPA